MGLAAASKCSGKGSSQERLLSSAEVGQYWCAVFRAAASLLAQHTVSSPYRGLPSPPAFSNWSSREAEGSVPITPSPRRPAISAPLGPPAAITSGGGAFGRV